MHEQGIRCTSAGTSGENLLDCKNVYTNWLADDMHSGDDGRPCSTIPHRDSAESPPNTTNPVRSLPSPASAAARLTRAAWHSKDPQPASHVHTLKADGATTDVKGVAFTRMSAGAYLTPSPQASTPAKMKPASQVPPSHMGATSSKTGQGLHHTAFRNVSRRSAGPAGPCSAAPASQQLPQLTSKQTGGLMPTKQTVPTRAAGPSARGQSRHSSVSTGVMAPNSSGRGPPGRRPTFKPDAAALAGTDDGVNKTASPTAPSHGKNLGDGVTSAQSEITVLASDAGQGASSDVCADADSVACRRLTANSEVSTVFESVGESFGGMSTDSTEGSASGQAHTPAGLPGLRMSRKFKAVRRLTTSRQPCKRTNLLHAMYDKTAQSALLNSHYRSSLDAAISRSRTSNASELPGSVSQLEEGAQAGGAIAMELLTRCDPSSVIAAMTTIASVSASVAAAAAAQVAAAAVAELETSQAAANVQLTATHSSAEAERSTQHATAVHAAAPGSTLPPSGSQVPAQADQSIVLQLFPSAAPFLALQALRSKRIELVITPNAVFCTAHDPCPADGRDSCFLRAALKRFSNRVTTARLALVTDSKDVCSGNEQSREEATQSDGDGMLQEPAACACSVSSASVKGAQHAIVSSAQPGCYPSLNICRWLQRRGFNCAPHIEGR